MRAWSVFLKTVREQIRDKWVLLMAMGGAPFFVAVYALFVGSGTTYTALVLNQDEKLGPSLVAALRQEKALKIETVQDLAAAQKRVEGREAALLLVIPREFSAGPARVEVIGDMTDPNYAVAAVLVGSVAERLVQARTGARPLLQFEDKPLGRSGSMSGLDMYVPGLLVIAILMSIYPIAMGLVREVERGTLRRLQLTRMTALDYLAGSSVWYMILSVVATALAFVVAVGFGFRTSGSIPLAMLIAALGTFSMVAIALVVVAFARSATDVATVGSFPLLFMMFFSGAAMPAPRTELFSWGPVSVALGDLLPPSFAVTAMNKVLTLGSDFRGVLPELVAMVGVSAVYFAVGVVLFRRRHLRAA